MPYHFDCYESYYGLIYSKNSTIDDLKMILKGEDNFEIVFFVSISVLLELLLVTMLQNERNLH